MNLPDIKTYAKKHNRELQLKQQERKDDKHAFVSAVCPE